MREEDPEMKPEEIPFDPVKEQEKIESRWTRIRGFVTILVSLIAAGAIAFCCYQERLLDMSHGRVSDAEHEQAMLQLRINEVAEEAAYQDRWNAYLQEKIRFYTNNCVIVTKSGKKYHAYGCTSVPEGTAYRILNVEAAVTQGYTPCTHCDPPEAEAENGELGIMGPVPELKLPVSGD